MPRATVLVTARMFGRMGGAAPRRLEAAGYHLRYPSDRNRPPQQDELRGLLEGVEAVIAGVEPWTADLMEAAPALRLICRFGVGYDSVDLQAATRRGILVAITPATNHVAVAEHTMGLILAVLRRLPLQDARAKRGEWVPEPGPELRGRTLGVVGLGRIGREVADLARAFGMRVVACEIAPDEAFVTSRGITLVDLRTLLREADVVTLHVPLTAATRRLIDATALRTMKRGSYLINTARGGLVDEAALYDALTSGHLAGAGLDVTDPEPPADWRLARLPQVVMTPHAAGLSTDAIARMEEAAVETTLAVLRGELPSNLLNPEAHPAQGR
ncbi:MAG: phosphoglycerate dehydrogenase [Armatimonadota bacterium]|nr:phosphoglycerate dehydrogenase [Armatimonadota bacterium]MDR7427250.1 phosphoglycerate dehydrogenase [Armatimonadota bacterium]MDR7463176.1 phosphoglycerate dehydrogenase [Armatimonadota bacterium]MDR7468837.1 phosphoglycerate dehydrogenase [Armatimonadota bacterium]MDR7475421.1 phosphoglycerate dehydrogenase [Armatimonadota bacterium]